MSRGVSEGPTDALTLFIQMIEKVFLNRIEGPCLNQTGVLALRSRFEELHASVHSCFSVEVPYYC